MTLEVGMVESLQGIPWSDENIRRGPGYNGQPIGPTLRVKPGDVLAVTLKNHLDPAPQSDIDYYDFLMDPNNDDVNLTIVANRLSPIGNMVSDYTEA